MYGTECCSKTWTLAGQVRVLHTLRRAFNAHFQATGEKRRRGISDTFPYMSWITQLEHVLDSCLSRPAWCHAVPLFEIKSRCQKYSPAHTLAHVCTLDRICLSTWRSYGQNKGLARLDRIAGLRGTHQLLVANGQRQFAKGQVLGVEEARLTSCQHQLLASCCHIAIAYFRFLLHGHAGPPGLPTGCLPRTEC